MIIGIITTVLVVVTTLIIITISIVSRIGTDVVIFIISINTIVLKFNKIITVRFSWR